MNAQFPELVEAFSKMEGDFVLDGEILAVLDDQVLNFSVLQQRLNRKIISAKMMREIPIQTFIYDILEVDGEDLRDNELKERRVLLENLIAKNAVDNIKIPPVVIAKDWEELAVARENSRDNNSEGLMLKQKSSKYHSGRKKEIGGNGKWTL